MPSSLPLHSVDEVTRTKSLLIALSDHKRVHELRQKPPDTTDPPRRASRKSLPPGDTKDETYTNPNWNIEVTFSPVTFIPTCRNGDAAVKAELNQIIEETPLRVTTDIEIVAVYFESGSESTIGEKVTAYVRIVPTDESTVSEIRRRALQHSAVEQAYTGRYSTQPTINWLGGIPENYDVLAYLQPSNFDDDFSRETITACAEPLRSDLESGSCSELNVSLWGVGVLSQKEQLVAVSALSTVQQVPF